MVTAAIAAVAQSSRCAIVTLISNLNLFLILSRSCSVLLLCDLIPISYPALTLIPTLTLTLTLYNLVAPVLSPLSLYQGA